MSIQYSRISSTPFARKVRKILDAIRVTVEAPVSGSVSVKDSSDVNIGAGHSSRNKGPRWPIWLIAAVTIALVIALIVGVDFSEILGGGE